MCVCVCVCVRARVHRNWVYTLVNLLMQLNSVPRVACSLFSSPWMSNCEYFPEQKHTSQNVMAP